MIVKMAAKLHRQYWNVDFGLDWLEVGSPPILSLSQLVVPPVDWYRIVPILKSLKLEYHMYDEYIKPGLDIIFDGNHLKDLYTIWMEQLKDGTRPLTLVSNFLTVSFSCLMRRIFVFDTV